MTFAEKAGRLFQTMIVVGSGDLSEPNSTFGVNSAEYMVKGQQLTHFNVIRGRRRRQDAGPVAEPATAGGKHQARYTGGTPYRPAEPLHRNVGTAPRALSQWPETLGLAAIGSAELVVAPVSSSGVRRRCAGGAGRCRHG
jgi:beta-glucosidase